MMRYTPYHMGLGIQGEKCSQGEGCSQVVAVMALMCLQKCV